MPASRKPLPSCGQAQDGRQPSSPAHPRQNCSSTLTGSNAPVPSLYEDQSGVIRALLDRPGHDREPSILIGGWATFVRAGGEISLDIDLITSQESRHKLEHLMTDLSPAIIIRGENFARGSRGRGLAMNRRSTKKPAHI